MNLKKVSLLFKPLTILAVAAFALAASSARAEEKMEIPFDMQKPALDVGLIVSNVDKAKEFYGAALGLKPLPPPIPLPDDGTMTRYQAGATTIKLLNYKKTPPKVEGGVPEVNGIRLITIYVQDGDAVTKRLTEHGFADPKLQPLPGGSKYGFVADPDGNAVEIVALGANAKPEALERFAIGLTVSDAEKSREFYGKTLGLKEEAPQSLAIMNGTMKYSFDAGKTVVKFWSPKGDRPTRTGAMNTALGIRYFTFMVKDTDAAYETLQKRGAKIAQPPTDLGRLARIMFATDPDGNMIEFAGPVKAQK